MLRIKGQSGVWVKAATLALATALLFGAASQSLAQERDSPVPNSQSLIVRVFNQVIDWTVNTWQSVVSWVIEQGTHLARAFSFWSEEPVAQAPASEPKVLGEEVSQQLSLSPLTYKTELVAPAKTALTSAKPVLTPPSAPTETTLPSEPQVLPPVPEPTPAPVETVPTQPETAPIPESTPEVLSEPIQDPQPEESKQQSSSYYIPILARDTIAPTSSVSALATTTASNIFTVSWTGEDMDITGSPAVESFDIQYQVDSGAWTDWLLETVLLSSSFETPLAIENTYGFRSRARDRSSNLENYPDSADTSIYVNLVVPNAPQVSTPSDGYTFSSSNSTYDVTLTGAGDPFDIVTITLSPSTIATTTVAADASWSKQFTIAEGANNFTLQSQEADGDVSTATAFSLNLDVVPTHDVVINEIAWMGTTAASNDEWIELYNASSTAISLADWTLAASDGAPNITLAGTIGAKSYFLLERTSSTTVSNIAEDQIYTGALVDGGELLTLRKDNGSLVDKAGSATTWFAGDGTTKTTMERKNPTSGGTTPSNWATNDGVFITGQDNGANNIKGTPKSLNSQNTTIPRSVTDLQIQFIYTTTTSVRLYWTTPKTANLATTTPATYDVRYLPSASCPITESNWSDVGTTQVTGEPVPSTTEGTAQTANVTGLTQNTSYCFAMKTNNGENDSGLSNIYYATTEDGNYTTQAGYPGSGVLASSTSPYLVTMDINIPAGNTLTIQPGTVVKMFGTKNIILGAGSSLVIGSATDSVNAAVITSQDDDTYNGQAKNNIGTVVSDASPAAGDWGRISISSGTISMNRAVVRYGGVSLPMVQINGGSVTVNNSILEYSNTNIIAMAGDTTAITIANSTIRGGALLPTPAGADGIGISTLANATISGSTFTGNRRGIAIDATADEANLSISGNNFYVNNRVAGPDPNAGMHVSDTDGTAVVAQNNWWGSALGPTLDTHSTADDRDGALDNNDGSLSAANLDISNFATSAFSILPSGL